MPVEVLKVSHTAIANEHAEAMGHCECLQLCMGHSQALLILGKDL